MKTTDLSASRKLSRASSQADGREGLAGEHRAVLYIGVVLLFQEIREKLSRSKLWEEEKKQQRYPS